MILNNKLIKNDRVVLLLLVSVITLGYCLSVLVVERNMIFDDSFISYRYSYNIAHGYGLTWNPGEAPTEGYTNFLLVILLVPFIKLGIDPLFATRLLSCIAAAGLVFLIFLSSRFYDLDKAPSLILSLLFLLVGRVSYIITLGLETVIFAFLLFLTFVQLLYYRRTSSARFIIYFSLTSFFAFLMRPEAILLVTISAVFLFFDKEDNKKAKKTLSILFCCFACPLIIYIIWKQIHFGTILPNSFYIKTGRTFITKRGILSIFDFVKDNKVILLCALLAVLFQPRWNKIRVVPLIFIGAFMLFYAHVLTLMNAYNRMLYPVVPVLYFIALPILGLVLDKIYDVRVSGFVKVPVTLIFILFSFPPSVHDFVLPVTQLISNTDPHENKNSLMQKEYMIGKKLAGYHDIKNIRIALGDAGAMPYFSGAKILDVVGLNDTYISRERNIPKLVDYVFGRKPDLIFYPVSGKDFKPFICDHGPLGDLTLWASDKRWKDYRYAGTVTPDSFWYHLLINKDYKDFQALSLFIKDNIADVVYEKMPTRLGE